MLTGIITLVIGWTVNKQGMECSLAPTGTDTRDNSRIIRGTERAHRTLLTGITIQVIGSTVNEQAMVFSLGPTGTDTRENSIRTL
jgi:hypothetical protein